MLDFRQSQFCWHVHPNEHICMQKLFIMNIYSYLIQITLIHAFTLYKWKTIQLWFSGQQCHVHSTTRTIMKLLQITDNTFVFIGWAFTKWLSGIVPADACFSVWKYGARKQVHEPGTLHHAKFLVVFYVSTWFTSPKLLRAPNSDLLFIKQLFDVSVVKLLQTMCEAALKKFFNDLWYLGEELINLLILIWWESFNWSWVPNGTRFSQ